VVVIDAFGVSTWKAAKKVTGFFNNTAQHHLTKIHSVMPSITPVNFATMLTGASPEIHGIRARTQSLNHETIFHVLKEKNKKSATAARALSSLGILISPHADFSRIAKSNKDEEVTQLVLNLIEYKPDLIWVQLLDVDDYGHSHGPLSTESIEACARADDHLKTIAVAASMNGYGLIALADHGQHSVVEDGVIKGTHGTNMAEDLLVPLVWADNNVLMEILS
jgi:predicted AlkP superfamily pyrophosphatase or phosphodiesterase